MRLTMGSRRFRLVSVVAFLWATVLGCEESPTAPSGPSPLPSPPLGGAPPVDQPGPAFRASGDNWSFRAAGFEDYDMVNGDWGWGGPEALAALDGAVNLSSAPSTAVLVAFGDCWASEEARFTGSLSGGVLEMESQSLRGRVIRITGTLSAGGSRFNGTYSITGGCAAATGDLIGQRLSPVDGFWTGDGITFSVTEGSRPMDDGSFALSGTALYANTDCFPDARIDGFVRGRIFMPVVTSGSRRVEYRGNVELDQSRTYVAGRLAMGQSCPEFPDWEGTHVARLVRH